MPDLDRACNCGTSYWKFHCILTEDAVCGCNWYKPATKPTDHPQNVEVPTDTLGAKCVLGFGGPTPTAPDSATKNLASKMFFLGGRRDFHEMDGRQLARTHQPIKKPRGYYKSVKAKKDQGSLDFESSAQFSFKGWKSHSKFKFLKPLISWVLVVR